ncbi:MAG: chorismate synthase [Phycisphaerales bacterium]|nr:chorismate synthase [Phycisphaerales bacterium]
MGNLSFSTAGESHGPSLIALVEGFPEGVTVDESFINAELVRRQGGYGRGARQRIEADSVEFLSGLRRGVTIGSPIAMRIVNKDCRIDDPEKAPPLYRPRPGHADLAGSIKWLTTDCRGVLERASARETAARTAAGALSRCLLREFGIEAFAFVRGSIGANSEIEVTPTNWRQLQVARDGSEVACPDAATDAKLVELIRTAKIQKDTVGGLCETHVFGCPPGLGSCMSRDLRLDSRLASAVMGIQAFKSVEIGLGRAVAMHMGSQVHDPIGFDESRRQEPCLGYVRSRNNAGGLEGGMTNGMPIVVTGAMKPISTLLQGMPSVDLRTHQPEQSTYERSDVSAVAAASVVMENVVAFEVARAFLEKFGGDTLREVRMAYEAYLSAARALQ